MLGLEVVAVGLLGLTFLVIVHLLAESSPNFSAAVSRATASLRAWSLPPSPRTLEQPVPIPTRASSVRQEVLPDDVGAQYRRITSLKREISQFRVEGRSEGEITLLLRKRGWDPQIVSLTLGRTRRWADRKL